LINLEIKIPVDALAPFAERARAAGAEFRGTLRQVDTYFGAARGRLKVREIETGDTREAELIAYDRPTVDGSRVSDYVVYPAADPALLIETLSRCLARGVTVKKSRDLWMFGGTRIHLDTVEGLGTFVELETEGNTRSGEATKAEHERVMDFLELDRATAIAGSYEGMLTGAL